MKCHVVWTPSHKGIRINEEADNIVRLAAEKGANVEIKLTPNTIKN